MKVSQVVEEHAVILTIVYHWRMIFVCSYALTFLTLLSDHRLFVELKWNGNGMEWNGLL